MGVSIMIIITHPIRQWRISQVKYTTAMFDGDFVCVLASLTVASPSLFAFDAFGTVDYDNTFAPVALPNALPKACSR
jgi:hypothetical protein